MKFLKTAVFALLLSPAAYSAVTVNLQHLDVAAGAPFDGLVFTDTNSARQNFSYSYGTFASGFNFNTTAASVLSGFVSATDATTATSTTPGLINSPVTYNGGTTAAPTSIVGQPAYLLVGNNSNLLLSTHIAVIFLNTNFIAGDAVGNATLSATAFSIDRVVYGAIGGAPTSQPAGPYNFTKSIQLVNAPIPEPSTALLGALGALGLLRRKRA